MTSTATRRARLAEIALPDFGMPDDGAAAAGVDLRRAGSSGFEPRMEARGYDHLVVWGDREHSANLAYLTGFDPRFEEAVLIVGDDGRSGDPRRQRVLRPGGRRRCRCGRVRFQDLSLPGQPRDDSRPLAEILARRGHRAGQPGGGRRLEDVREPRDDRGSGVPRRRAPARPRARPGWWRTRPTSSSTPPTGSG